MTLLVAYGWLFFSLLHVGITIRLYAKDNRLPVVAHFIVGFIGWPIFLPLHLGHILAEKGEP